MAEPEDFSCPDCDGTGMAVPDCEVCEAKGWVPDPKDGGTKCCPECDGDVCATCLGTGEQDEPADP